MLAILILSAFLMYVPGMIWLVGLCLILNWKHLDDLFTRQLPIVTIGTLAAILMVVPLGWAIYQTPSVWKIILNLPQQGWPSLLPTLKHIAEVPLHLFIYGQGNPVYELGHLPALSIFSLVMFGFGVYVYTQHAKLRRFRTLAAFLVAGCIVVGLGGPTNIGFIVPFLFIVVSAGIGYLLQQWYKVFPRNPVAQTVGVSTIVIVVLLAFTYNVRAYFDSWANASSTQSVFQLADVGSPKSLVQ